jgi:hypothetical protein
MRKWLWKRCVEINAHRRQMTLDVESVLPKGVNPPADQKQQHDVR